MTASEQGWLDGEVALVTGGASGVGRAVVERFVAEGARVCIVDRDADAAAALAGDDERLLAVGADVRDPAAMHEAVARTVERFGRLTVAVPNAGIWDYNESLTTTDGAGLAAILDEVLAINVKGYLLTVEAAWRELVRHEGSVVMTLSNAATMPNGGGPAYTASKHACLGLLRELAYELAPRVRVNGVAVGGMRTGLSGPSAAGLDRLRIADVFDSGQGVGDRPHIPLRAASTDPTTVTGAYVYLAARTNSANVTGAVIPADGGIAVRGFRGAAGGDDLLDLAGPPATTGPAPDTEPADAGPPRDIEPAADADRP